MHLTSTEIANNIIRLLDEEVQGYVVTDGASHYFEINVHPGVTIEVRVHAQEEHYEIHVTEVKGTDTRNPWAAADNGLTLRQENEEMIAADIINSFASPYIRH